MSEIKYIGQMSSSQNSRVIDQEGISYAVTNGHKDGEPKIIERIKPVCVGNMLPNKSKCGRDMQAGRIYDPNAISPCLTIMSGGNTEPKIIEPIGCAMRGRNPENPSERTDFGKQVRKQYEAGELDMSRHDMIELEPRTDGVSNTLTSVQKDNLVAEPIFGVSVHPISHALEFKGEESIKKDASPALRATDYKCPHVVWENQPSYRIRKLTPRECFRLMGVCEADIDKIQSSGISKTQQYKMAGNSIVVDVLYHIFRKMYIETGQESEQLSLF